MTTDNYGFETSWTLEKLNGSLVQKGPPNDTKYGDNTRYFGGLCLSAGRYNFTVNDKFEDGMCCQNGRGSYDVYIDGSKRFSSPSDDTKWGKREHLFTISGSSSSSGINNDSISQASSRGGCSTVKIEFKIDKYGKETTVMLQSSSGSTILSSVNEVDAYDTKTLSSCVMPGDYTFTIKDKDGLCCSNGDGYFKLSVDGTQLFEGGYFIEKKSFDIKIGYDYESKMSTRDKEWLTAHNSRRRTYHEANGKTYLPLRWSSSLASDALVYASKLLDSCNNTGILHESGVTDEENLAKNKGKGTWGSEYPADNILKRWVENEDSWDWPKNAHLTQAIWYATHYVGCGEASKYMDEEDETCRIQVCRYVRAGDCAIKNGDWKAEAFKDDTGCGDPCPREGCFA